MSKHKTITVKCPKCNSTGNFELWDSINVTLDPNMKSVIFNNEQLFTYHCNHCSSNFHAPYAMLYNDMTNKFMIWVVPSGKRPENIPFLSAGNIKLRYVQTLEELREKITELESSYPDYLLELYKYDFWATSGENCTPSEAFSLDDISIEKDGDALILKFKLHLPVGTYQATSEINNDFMKNLLKKYPIKSPTENGFLRINSTWIKQTLNV